MLSEGNINEIEKIKDLLKFLKGHGWIPSISKTIDVDKTIKAIEHILQDYTRQKQINEEHKKENEELKATINKQSIDISKNLLELQQKDKQIDLMAEVMFKSNKAQLLIEYGIENKEQIIKEFEKLVKEKGE